MRNDDCEGGIWFFSKENLVLVSQWSWLVGRESEGIQISSIEGVEVPDSQRVLLSDFDDCVFFADAGVLVKNDKGEFGITSRAI